MTNREHWESIYAQKSPDGVSWYRPRLTQSLTWIDRCALRPSAHVADMGGGASTLVDDLLARGFRNVSVVDLAEHALAHSKARLGECAAQVRWIVGDVTTELFDDASLDLWHDRAVFHFLTRREERDAYVEQVRRCVRRGGHVILATFGPDGPERCSGLPVVRYASADLAAALGSGFELLDAVNEEHLTPWSSTQRFAYALCRRWA